MLLGCNIWQSKKIFMHTFVHSVTSTIIPLHSLLFIFLLSKHLLFTYLNFTVTVTVTIHAVVAFEAAANCRLFEGMVREFLNTLATKRCCVILLFLQADRAPLPALQAANGKPSVDGLRQWSDPELQDTMRRLSSNPEDRSRLASALSCLKSASEAGKPRW